MSDTCEGTGKAKIYWHSGEWSNNVLVARVCDRTTKKLKLNTYDAKRMLV